MICPMTMSDQLWEDLIKPISADKPCGDYLVYEVNYDDIQAARLEEDANLPQGIWKREIKKADWSQVVSLCIEVLTHKTKDLQIAAWLMEGWTIQHSAQGLKWGLKLIEAYCHLFWETLHPLAKEGDPEFRLAPFDWIDQKFSERLNFLPLTLNEMEGSSYTFLDWEKANKNFTTLSDTNKKTSPGSSAAAAKEITLAEFHKAAEATPQQYYEDLSADLQESLDLCMAIEALLYHKHSEFPGHLHHLKSQIQTLLTCVTVILKEKKPLLAAMDSVSASSNIPTKGQLSMIKSSADHPLSREEAYQRLAHIADYLALIEPHSPSPYLIRRAISWGKMSVIDLLQEIVRDKADYQQILQLLGVNAKEHS